MGFVVPKTDRTEGIDVADTIFVEMGRDKLQS